MTSAETLYEVAQRYFPGGVTATARANPAIGRPFYISRGDGPYVYDLDGREYVDMCISHGASLLGHNHPRIRAAVALALELGVICAYETEHHVALARLIAEMVPCAEMVRFAGSGTESVMHALRLARTATGRETVIKFEGHFHGYSDFLNYSWAPPLDQAGPAEAPIPYRESAGIPPRLDDLVVVVPFNDPDALEAAFASHGRDTAALILEPINYDSGCIPPRPGFLQLCRELCDRYGALLLFDEVLTAFRMAPGGAQEYTGVIPDLCVLGKAFGGGMPISAIAGRREVMRHLKPLGRSELSGTYLAHLTAVLAASAALETYREPGLLRAAHGGWAAFLRWFPRADRAQWRAAAPAARRPALRHVLRRHRPGDKLPPGRAPESCLAAPLRRRLHSPGRLLPCRRPPWLFGRARRRDDRPSVGGDRRRAGRRAARALGTECT